MVLMFHNLMTLNESFHGPANLQTEEVLGYNLLVNNIYPYIVARKWGHKTQLINVFSDIFLKTV